MSLRIPNAKKSKKQNQEQSALEVYRVRIAQYAISSNPIFLNVPFVDGDQCASDVARSSGCFVCCF